MPTDADDPGVMEEEAFVPPQPQTEPVRKPAAPRTERQTVSAVPRDNTPPPPPMREVDDRWPELLEQFKARLPMAKRAFLNMTGGRMEGDQLLIECDNDLVKSTLSKEDVLDVFKGVAAQVLGREVAVQVITKGAGAPAARRSVPQESPAPAAPAPKQGAASAGQQGSPLDHLISKMQGFDNLKVE